MNNLHSLTNRAVALVLSIVLVIGLLPAQVLAQDGAVAKIGDTTYGTLEEALAAVPTGTDQNAPAEATTVTLLRDTTHAFDMGTSTGSQTMNLKLDLGGHTLTLAPGTGSVGTKTAGIRVLAYSKLEVLNGTLACSDKKEDNIKVGIANYGTLTLTDVIFKSGAQTLYTINNRGALTLAGKTAVESGSVCAVTNDPYDLYYTTDFPASVTCHSADVTVESLMVERYARNSANKGGVELNISAGYFGKITEDGSVDVPVTYNVTGGVIAVSNTAELNHALSMVQAGAAYTCPENPVTIRLLEDLSGSFDVGISNGKAPKNIVLDLNGKTMTLSPSVGSAGTKTAGIRVLAYSKLTVLNGTLIASSAEEDTVKVSIANYGELILNDVTLRAGNKTIYTVNNRGALILSGKTTLESGSSCAVTNDPYNLYYTTNVPASVFCAGADVLVESMLVERYARNSTNQGGVELNISAGYFGKITEDGHIDVPVTYNVTGGIIGVSDSAELKQAVAMVKAGAAYAFPENPVTIRLLEDLSGSFDVGTSNGKAPKNIVLDLNGKTMTLSPSVGSAGTKTAGIRVLAYSRLTVLNGTLIASSAEEDTVKVGIANYGELILNDVTLRSGNKTIYTINNRGSLTLSGTTSVENGQVAQDDYSDSAESIAITNDPYNWYYTTPINAQINCGSEQVSVGNIQLETYGTKGNIELNITAGTFGGVYQPAADGTVLVLGAISGGTFDTDVSNYCAKKYTAVAKDDKYVVEYVKDDQVDFGFADANDQITFSETENKFTQPALNGVGTVTYSIVTQKNVFGEEAVVAEIDPATGELTILMAGVVVIKAVDSGNALFNPAEDTYTLEILRAEQEGFGFPEDSDEITFNDVDKNGAEGAGKTNAFTLITSGGQTQGVVTFEILEGDAATLDENGVLTILKSGTVKIKATKAGDERYNDVSAEFLLTVKKATQSFTFDHETKIEKLYGLRSFRTQVTAAALSSGVLLYDISENNIGASVDENGLVTFTDSEGKVGSATVTVLLAGDDRYEPYSASYTITLAYETAPETAYELFGDKLIGDSDWFTGDVTIMAPNGYQISYGNALSEENWGNSVVWSKDGNAEFWSKDENKADAPVVYLKNIETGAITDGIAVSDLMRDTVKPGNLSISYNTGIWAEIFDKIFHFSASDVEVEVSATDAMSGISKMEYSLDGGKNYTEITAKAGKYTFTVAPEYRGRLQIRVTDVAGNTETYACKDEEGTEKWLVVDSIAPGLDVSYEGTLDDGATEGIHYVKGDKVIISITVSDDNFDLRGQEPSVTVNGREVTAQWVNDATSGKLVFELAQEGDYLLKATFTDRLGKTVEYGSEIRIDRSAPIVDSTIEGGKYYTADQLFTLTVREHNFNAALLDLLITATNSKGETILSEDEVNAFAAMAKDPANWKTGADADEHTLTLPISKDGNYTLALNASDVLGQPADPYTKAFVLDKVAPGAPAFTFETLEKGTILDKLFGFSKEVVQVRVSVADVTGGVDRILLTVTPAGPSASTTIAMPVELVLNADGTVRSGELGFIEKVTVTGGPDSLELSFDLPANFRGIVAAEVVDKAGLSAKTTEQREIVVDQVAPNVSISFSGDRKDAVRTDSDVAITRETMETFDGQTRFVYSGPVTVTIRVVEANFFPTVDLPVTVLRDGKEVTDGFVDSGWIADESKEGTYTRTIVLQADGDYQIEAEYTDHSGNDMDWSSGEYDANGTARYVSNIHSVDTTAPVVEISYDNNLRHQNRDGRDYYDASRRATIKVTDRNFRPSDVSFLVQAVDVAGKAVEYSCSALTAWSDWTRDGNTWTATVDFGPDANYTLTFDYADLADNQMSGGTYTELFTVDTGIPGGLAVTYKSKDDQLLNKILEAITFGHYQAPQEVVLTMTDATAGMDYIKLTVTPDGPASATDLVLPKDLVINADGTVRSGQKGFIDRIAAASEGGNLTLRFDVPAQFRGKISFAAWDKSGNTSDAHADPGVLVVDTIAPGHTVTFNPSNAVRVSDMKNVADFDAANGLTDITSTEAAYVMYFATDAVAKIEIAEANFDPSQVLIQVLDASGNPVENWTMSQWATTVEENKADVHTATVTIAEEGDYRIKVFYQDHSMNKPVDYLSQWIVVDKTLPEINVAYSNTDVKNTIDGRDYFSDDQTATITIKEHNFRADDVQILVTAKDVLGADLLELNADGTVVRAYADQGIDGSKWSQFVEGSWRREDDTFVLTLEFSTDANYTFDIVYRDLACNPAVDYEQDLFTVDHKAPEKLTVTYDTSVFEQIKESVTFGYYNAKMTVTISAEDDISGVWHFVYSYIKGKDVSDVNAELLNQAIENAKIDRDGKKATARFEIPKMILDEDNQFNGTVSFTAYDRSENDATFRDKQIIVVDNISPTAEISYNAPVQTANGISYYGGNIDASIVITEANFDAKDVTVIVTKDGADYPVDVLWTDKNVDVHMGTFTLTEDGDYIVSVRYKDKSGNQMASYTSNELTLDTVKPTIRVSNIRNNSANKDEKYGFVITVDDINLDAASLKPVLKAVKQTAEGTYEIVEIPLGTATAVKEGQTYTYTVEDLPDDGLYTLTCEVKDMSANGMIQILLEDSVHYDAVRFSINRNGSAFGYGNEFTEKLTEQYFVYSVNEDVVIVEVNVDPIEDYKITLNGAELTEGTDYTTEQTSEAGQWSKRTYTVKKELFAAEGEYSLIVTSTDKANSTAFSDIKNLALSFVVDQTKPALTISGLESGGRYQTDEQTVTVIPTDEGGRLNSLKVLVFDADGNPLKNKETGEDISVRFNMSGEELLKHLEENDGMITFTIPSGLNNRVQIICNDHAVNAEDQTNEYDETFERVTVSQNQFVIFYANTPVFIGTVAGILAVIALVIFLLKRKSGKKSKTEAKA